MTARSSDNLKMLKNISFEKFGAYYLYKLNRRGAIGVLMIILSFVGFPLFAFSLLMTCGAYNTCAELEAQFEANQFSMALENELRLAEQNFSGWRSLSHVTPFVVVLAYLGILIAAFVVLLNNYRYTSGKRFVDMDYSLPVSDDTRFFGDFLSGVTIMVVPMIAAAVTASCMLSTISPETPYIAESGLALWVVEYIPKLMWTSIFVAVMFYIFSLLIVVCCSRTVEARIVPLVMNVAVPAIVLTATIMIVETSYGTTSAAIMSCLTPFAVTSPAGAGITAIMRSTMTEITPALIDDNYEIEQKGVELFSGGEWAALIIATLLYLAAAYVLFKIRRSERVGTPYAFKIMRHIVPTAVTFAIVFIMLAITAAINYRGGLMDRMNPFTTDNYGNLTAFMILAFVLFFVMELISGKGLKRFWLTAIRFAVTVAAGYVIFLGTAAIGTKSLETYVPNADAVEYAVMTTQRSGFIQLRDPDDIKRLTEIQRRIIDERNEKYTGASVGISYRMKDGSTVIRQYRTLGEVSKELISLNMETGGYVSEYWLNGTYDTYYGGYDPYPIQIPLFTDERNPGVEFSRVYCWEGEQEIIDIDIDPLTLYQAIIDDAREVRFDDIYNADTKQVNHNISFNYTDYHGLDNSTAYVIRPCFKRTYALLEQAGIKSEITPDDCISAYLVDEEMYNDICCFDNPPAWDDVVLDGYDDRVEIPLDSALLDELYGAATTSAQYYGNEGTDEIWRLLLVTEKVESEDEKYAYSEYNGSYVGYADTAVVDTADYNPPRYRCLMLTIPKEYHARAAEIFASLKG